MSAWVTLDALMGVAHLPRLGDQPDGSAGPPGAMCGSQLGPLLGMAPAEGVVELVTSDPRWSWCPRCYPRGAPLSLL